MKEGKTIVSHFFHTHFNIACLLLMNNDDDENKLISIKIEFKMKKKQQM